MQAYRKFTELLSTINDKTNTKNMSTSPVTYLQGKSYQAGQ